MPCAGQRVIPIRTLAPPPGVWAGPVAPPSVSGPSERLDRVLGALQPSVASVLGHPADLGTWMQALQIGDDEANLKLRGDLGCKARDVAEAAFGTLRRMLPDTDIYVGL
jgi:hypothetical protein